MNQQQRVRLFRERFYGRQDVFGRRWESTTEDGRRRIGYAPVCDNHWKSNCHLRLKDGIRCDNCEVKKYTPVSDETVLKHLHGDEQHIYYVLQTDGSIKFGSIDFDMKIGKEDKGYSFDDVKKVLDICKEWGVPHGVARSTGNGFHVYFFMSEFVHANKFRAFIFELFERVGFMELLRQGIKPLPEIFPKQSYNSADGIGNGIRPPMTVTGMVKRRNCWVSEDNQPIGELLDEPAFFAAQWEHMAQIPTMTAAELDVVIAKYDIQVVEDGPGVTPTSSGSKRHISGQKRSGKYEPPITGSIEKILEGCAAFRRVKDKVVAGEVLGHTEGFALFHMCMRTADGLAWFRANVKGWGENETDMKQLEHSVKKDYSPWTCLKLRNEGICLPRTECFKKPPIDVVEGRLIERNDVPVEQWPEPSPIRYAYGKGDDFLLKIQKEADELQTIDDHEQKLKAIRDLVFRAQVFDKEQQDELKAHLKKLKLIKANEIAKIFSEASVQATEELRKTANERSDTVDVHGNMYQKVSPFGYSAMKLIRSNTKTAQLCANDIWIEEIRTYIDEGTTLQTVYRGTVKAEGVEKKFELDTSKWRDNTKFMEYFEKILNQGFNVLRQNVDFIRQAAMGFSARHTIQHTQYFVTQGWYGDAYLMPSVIVDKDGARPNTEQRVDLSHKEHAKNLDFQLLNDDEFKEVALHLKSEMLSTWPRQWTMIALAHCLSAGVMKPLGLTQKPTLFFEGLTGSGKTQLTHLLQHFWGNFESILNLGTSAKGAADVANDFKDSWLVIDDFKGLDNQQVMAVKSVVQYGYDPTNSIKMRRDMTQNKAKSVRSVTCMSGEHFIENQASMVARSILVEVDKQDTSQTKDLYVKCWQMCKKYNGITPRFIHWFLNNDKKVVKARLEEIKRKLFDGICGRQNAERLSYNLGLNHLVWQLWCDFLLHSEVVVRDEHASLIEEHWHHCVEIQGRMVSRCEDEQSGVVFARVLKTLITSKEVAVTNLKDYEPDRKSIIGYVPAKDGRDVNIAHFYPDVCFKIVKGYSKDIEIEGSERAIARQLREMGIIMECDKGRLKKLVWNGGDRIWVWVIDLEALGLRGGQARLSVANSTEPMDFRPGIDPKKDDDGIY